jgi:putative transposase
MLERWWAEIAQKYANVRLDEFVIMPNHLHGILWIDEPVGAALCGRPNLMRVLDWFKTMTTNEYIRGVGHNGWPEFNRHLWQRGFFDHVIRTEKALNAIRRYIIENPLRWSLDRENPDSLKQRAAT